MGGFLSAFYAMLCFAFIEDQCVRPMFIKLGLPGGIKRYLDDVLVVLFCSSQEQIKLAEAFVQSLAGVYPHPLKLNLEAEGDQDADEDHDRSGEDPQTERMFRERSMGATRSRGETYGRFHIVPF